MQFSVTSGAAWCLVGQTSGAVAGQEGRRLAQHLLLGGGDGYCLDVDVIVVVPATIHRENMKTFNRAVATILIRQQRFSTHVLCHQYYRIPRMVTFLNSLSNAKHVTVFRCGM